MSSFEHIAGDTLAVPLQNPVSSIPARVKQFRHELLGSVGATGGIAGSGNRPETFVRLLRRACLEDQCRAILLALRADEAQHIVDAMQLTLDESHVEDDFRRHILYLLVKLCAQTNYLPTSLFIHGVDIGPVRDPCSTGGFADIYRARYGQLEVAVKKLRFFEENKEVVHQSFCKEALVWRYLDHPNVLKFLGVDAETFASTNYICMVSPWMPNGTLARYMGSPNYEAIRDCFRVLTEVASGLAYLHSQKVVHADIHGGNIFIDVDGHAVLADFGLVTVGETTMDRMSTTNGTAGSIRYMAPERIDPVTQALRRKPAVDVYAFACLCYLMYTGLHPFHEHRATYTVILEIMCGKRPARPQADVCRTWLSDAMWSIIEECWAQAPERRPVMHVVQDRLRRLPDAYAVAEHSDEPNRRSYRGLARLSIPVAAASGIRPLPTPPLSASPTVHAPLSETLIQPLPTPRPSPSFVLPVLPDETPCPPVASSRKLATDLDEQLDGRDASRAFVLNSASSSASHFRQWSLYDNTLRHGATRDVQRVPDLLFSTSSPDDENVHRLSFKLPASKRSSTRRSHTRNASVPLALMDLQPPLGDVSRTSVQRWANSEPDLFSTPAAGDPSAEEEEEELDRILLEATRVLDCSDGLVDTNQAPDIASHPETKVGSKLQHEDRIGRLQRCWKKRWPITFTKPSVPGVGHKPEKFTRQDAHWTVSPITSSPGEGRPYLFRARTLYDRLFSHEAPNNLVFAKDQMICVIRANGMLWRARDDSGLEGDIHPIYLKVQVLFKAVFDGNLVVDVLGVDDVWWTAQMPDSIISRCHHSLFSIDLATSLSHKRVVHSSYWPREELARHLCVNVGQVVLTDACTGEWALARLMDEAGPPRIGLIPTRILKAGL